MGWSHRRWRYRRHVQLPAARAASPAQRARSLRAAAPHRRGRDQGSAVSRRALQTRQATEVRNSFSL